MNRAEAIANGGLGRRLDDPKINQLWRLVGVRLGKGDRAIAQRS
jgi:hypothetical protein